MTTGTTDDPNFLTYSRYKHKLHGVRVGKKLRKYQLALVCNKAVTISLEKHRNKYVNETLFLMEETKTELTSLKAHCVESKPDLSCQKRIRKKNCLKEIKEKHGAKRRHRGKKRHGGKKRSKRSYYKFCRDVRRDFFSVSLKKLKLFRKRNCFTVLNEFTRCMREGPTWDKASLYTGFRSEFPHSGNAHN